MGRRRRDSESESDDAESEEYDSYDDESGSGDGSSDNEYDSEGDSSENEEEIIKDALKEAGMKKHFKALLKAGIDSVSAAEKCSDKKLTKIGISSSSDRKKILKAFEELEEGSSDEDEEESEDEETQIHDILKKYGQKKAVKSFEKYNIGNFRKAKKLTDSKLKKLGIEDANARKKILKALTQEDGEESGSESGSGSGSGSEDDDGDDNIIKKLLARASMKKYYSLFKKKGIETIEAAKNLQHKDLREMGIHLYRERRDILEQFEKYNGEELSSVSSGEEDETDNVNMVHEVLRQQYMSRHIPDFDRMGITTLRQARKLTQTQLRSMGVALYLQRERLINAFADYRPKNKDIMKILIDCNLASHAREFEKLIDVEEAKQLTHSDLRAMGINLYGQRERLMRAFMEWKPKKSKSAE